MNYRHAFHAGNFADLVKHAVLLAVIARLRADGGPLDVVDTHAGAGAYLIDDPSALRSGEAKAGVGRLATSTGLPASIRTLADAVSHANADGRTGLYPGSPMLALQALAVTDRYVGCELHPEDEARLRQTLKPWGPRAEAVHADGFEEAARRLARTERRTLVVVDPPFERADDYARAAALVAARPTPRRQPVLIWTPLKDLEGFDAFLGRLEAGRPSRLSALEVRLRPLRDPLRLNGCALVLVDGPDIADCALEAGRWIAETLGEAGGTARWLDLSAHAT